MGVLKLPQEIVDYEQQYAIPKSRSWMVEQWLRNITRKVQVEIQADQTVLWCMCY